MASNSDTSSEESAQEMPQVQPADNPSPSTQGETSVHVSTVPDSIPPYLAYHERLKLLSPEKQALECDMRIMHGKYEIPAIRAKLCEASPVLKKEVEKFSEKGSSDAFELLQHPCFTACRFIDFVMENPRRYEFRTDKRLLATLKRLDVETSGDASHHLHMFALGKFYKIHALSSRALSNYIHYLRRCKSPKFLPSLRRRLREIDAIEWDESSANGPVLDGTLGAILRIKKGESKNISNAEAIEECLSIDASEKLRTDVKLFLSVKENEVESDSTSYGSDSDSEPSKNVDDGEPVNPSSEAELPQAEPPQAEPPQAELPQK